MAKTKKNSKMRFYTIAVLIALLPAVFYLVKRIKEMPNQSTNQALKLSAAYQPLPLGSIKPQGWLLDQLKLQAEGLSGHLDEFWPDVKNSGWKGGKAEGWERAPYWLDGIVPLAVLTDDPKLKKKVTEWMDYILKHQNKDGWLGPDISPPATGMPGPAPEPRDPWPQFIMLKAMLQYEEGFGDPRVIPAMMRDLHTLDEQLNNRPLFSWNYFRWADLLVSLYWLYDRDQNPFLLNLARKAAAQGYSWNKHFADLPIKDRSKQWTWEGHVVNTAMGLKTSGLLYLLNGSSENTRTLERSWQALDRWHGQATGLFSGDECLAGRSPSQGTELCAISETMFSLEVLLSCFGDLALADRLEKIAYNAVPAIFAPDYWSHQYVEQANQVMCQKVDHPIYTTNNGEANTFGLEPHYGCCTANMHQAWPKFVSHMWMATPDNGLIALAYGPSLVQTKVAGSPVRIEVTTNYPFEETLTFKVTVQNSLKFPLYLRVPAWANRPTLTLPDGNKVYLKPGNAQKILRNWKGTETLTLSLPMTFALREGYNKAVSIERGPLVYSLGIKEKWKAYKPFKYQFKASPKSDWEVLPQSNWNYALDLGNGRHLEKYLTFKPGSFKGNPYTQESVPLHILVRGKRIAEWGTENGAASSPPLSPAKSSQPLEDLVLSPYGACRLRVTEFPVLE